jgi:hypothetical protein
MHAMTHLLTNLQEEKIKTLVLDIRTLLKEAAMVKLTHTHTRTRTHTHTRTLTHTRTHTHTRDPYPCLAFLLHVQDNKEIPLSLSRSFDITCSIEGIQNILDDFGILYDRTDKTTASLLEKLKKGLSWPKIVIEESG